MAAALADGQSLTFQRRLDKATPVHVAAQNGSYRFIREAMKLAPEAAWIQDAFKCRPFEHVWHRQDERSRRFLANAMFPETPPMPIPPEWDL